MLRSLARAGKLRRLSKASGRVHDRSSKFLCPGAPKLKSLSSGRGLAEHQREIVAWARVGGAGGEGGAGRLRAHLGDEAVEGQIDVVSRGRAFLADQRSPGGSEHDEDRLAR